ncbi:MAG: acyl-CoA dehydrogenase [Sphingomonadales bacterium]|nr:acyl-CoA dehydrogenase [Sphingomonadales bacterium]MBM3923706.1 acyl-CoA dehydrogenase [Sphingomonadales bacterium]
MDFNTSESTRMIGSSVKEFAARRIKPFSMEWDESQEFPRDLFKEMGQLGLMGVLVPEAYGGTGLGYEEYVEAIVELSKADPSIGLSMAAHNSLCTGHIMAFGNEEQKRRWLPSLASGEWIGAWGLTEPNTGSDAMRMLTTAVDKGDHWLLNGAKCWITHGNSAEIAVVMVRTGELLDSHGISALVVERGTEGWLQGRKENKLGMRCSETTEMIFKDCKIPKENLLGKVGDGFVQAMKILDGGRISIAALSLGIAKGALEAAVQYAGERQQFGKPIAEFQGIAFKLADMATEIEAAQLLTMEAAALKNAGKPVTKVSAMAKYYASEVAVRASTEAVQIFGGYGYTKDFPVEKYYRDSKLCTIGEGTSEIQKLVIARQLFKES